MPKSLVHEAQNKEKVTPFQYSNLYSVHIFQEPYATYWALLSNPTKFLILTACLSIINLRTISFITQHPSLPHIVPPPPHPPSHILIINVRFNLALINFSPSVK